MIFKELRLYGHLFLRKWKRDLYQQQQVNLKQVVKHTHTQNETE